MFQENIYLVKNNQHHPSLPLSRRSQRQRLRRQDPASSSSPETAAGSVTTIDPVTLPISNSVGVSTPPPTDNTEPSSTSDSSSPSSSCSITDTSSADSSSSLPLSSESTLTSSSESSSSTLTPPSTTTQPPYTRPYTLPYERSDPPMSQETSSSSGPTVTDTPPSSPSSSSLSTSTMSSSSVNPPPTSSSSSETQESTTTTDTSTTSTSTSDTSTSTSTSTSISSGGRGGPIDEISTTPTTTSTPPSTSDSSISTSPGGGSSSTSTSTSPSSADRPGDSTTGSPNPPTTTNGSGNPVTSVPMQNDGSPTAMPTMTLSQPVTFTTTDASGSTHLTVPPEFTTVIVTTLPGGTFTTYTEVVANPPGVLNPDDVNRNSVGAFFQNKGAVAGVFIAASLAICAIVLFVIFALRQRRSRFQTERDAEIAAGLAAAISHSRFADDEDHPVVFRNVQGRSPLLDEDDDAYNTATGLVMYSNSNGVGPPTQSMPTISEVPYPLTAARYAHARTNSGSPSPKRDSLGLPITSFEQVSPTGNSGRSSYGGAAYFGRDSSSPVPTTSAPASANHGTVANAPSVGHAPSSHGGHRPPASAGRGGSGNGTGSGSGGTSQPSLMTATPAQRGASSSDMYPPQYEQYSQPNSSAAVMGYAYEPDPVPHEHQIVTDLRAVRDPRDGMRSPLSADIAVSVASRSMYSRDGDEWDEEIAMSREDSRLDPVIRRTDRLESTASVGPRDEEDYSRRVMHQQLVSPSTGSNSHSMSHSHSNH